MEGFAMASRLGQTFHGKVSPAVIWGVGRNYRDHALELNNPIPVKPLIFLKAGAGLSTTQHIVLPSFSQDIHYELELAVLLDKQLQPEAVALALDLTARDEQKRCKERGEPWTLAKSFPGSCPVSSWFPFQSWKWFQSLSFQLEVNQQIRQTGQAKDMIFSLQDLVQYLQNTFPLSPGDVLLTGTPSGVGPLKAGDKIQAQLEDFSWPLECVAACP